MSNDDQFSGARLSPFRRSHLASFVVLLLAIALAVMVGSELTKSEVAAYIHVLRSTAPAGWPPEWFPEANKAEFDAFRGLQNEMLRSKSLLTRTVRDPAVSQYTFLARKHDPVEWLKKNLKIDYPNHGEVLRVRLFTHDPEEGVKVVNAVINTYFREVVEKEVTDRSRTEAKLQELFQILGDQLVRDKNDVQRLARALEDSGTTDSVELGVKKDRIKHVEQTWNELARQLDRLRITKQVPPRVRLLDEAMVEP